MCCSDVTYRFANISFNIGAFSLLFFFLERHSLRLENPQTLATVAPCCAFYEHQNRPHAKFLLNFDSSNFLFSPTYREVQAI